MTIPMLDNETQDRLAKESGNQSDAIRGRMSTPAWIVVACALAFLIQEWTKEETSQ